MADSIREYDRPDAQTFREVIYPAAKPAVMRGVGAELEAVELACQGAEYFADFLKRQVPDRQVEILTSRDEAGSTFFYQKDLKRLNFDRQRMAFGDFVDGISDDADDRMRYLESTSIGELSPSLASALSLPMMPRTIPPRLWLGNRTGTHTHFDVKQNVAYVVSGRRQFTLFPPDQTPNLYMAPFEMSPSNAPISLVKLDDPDFEMFPRFAEALDHAQTAELGPGDAIFIPYMWWHQVRATGTLNALVNYWWNEFETMGSPIDAMVHSILVLRDLPPPMRDAWRTMFDTYVFKKHGEPMDYLPPAQRGGLGPHDERMRMQLWQSLGNGLSQIMQKVFGGGQRR